MGQPRSQRPPLNELKEIMHPDGDDTAALALDLALFDTGSIEKFLAARGALLPADERELLLEWSKTPIAGYEVSQVDQGQSVVLQPLLGGDPVTLRDRLFSRTVRPHDLVLARLLSDGSQPCLVAPPVAVARDRRAELVDVLADYSPQRLAAFFRP